MKKGRVHSSASLREFPFPDLQRGADFIGLAGGAELPDERAGFWEKGQDRNDGLSLLKAVCDTLGRSY